LVGKYYLATLLRIGRQKIQTCDALSQTLLWLKQNLSKSKSFSLCKDRKTDKNKGFLSVILIFIHYIAVEEAAFVEFLPAMYVGLLTNYAATILRFQPRQKSSRATTRPPSGGNADLEPQHRNIRT
jgi:hypothetical protein